MGSSKRDVTVTRRSFRKKCVGCTRCSSCGSPNVTRWLDISTKENAKPSSEDQSEPSAEIALCSRCVTLRDRGNYCPLCNGCYEDDDYDSKMMECGRCGEWIHAHCESLNNEHYQILSFLPDTVEYVCRTCVLEASSNWLDAVNNELMAGCDAVIQALLSSKCAKHLVRREAQKFTNSLLTSPLVCLPNLNSSSMQKKAEIMEKGGSYLESINNSNQMVSDPSQCFFNIKEKLDTTGDPNIGTSVSNETQSLYLDKSISEGVTNVLENSIREGVSVDDQIAAVMDRTLLESIRHSVEENAILKSAMKVPEGGRCETGMMSNIDFSDRVSQLHSESSRVISSSEIRESQLSSENRGDMFGSDVTAARFEGDFYNDAKGEIREQSMMTCSANDDSRTKLKRRSTRSSSSWATLGPPDIGLGPSADSIKLRECSVRLQDICKSRSASSSPGIPMDEESEDSETPTENQHPNLMPKLSPRTGGDSMVTNKETSMLMAPLDSRTKNVSRGGLQAEREQDRNLASGLHGLLTAKETDLPCSLGRDVSCTQVDGPNDETTTAAHVIRNLFYEERNLSMLDSANLLDKKSDVLNPEKKSSIKNSSLLQIENQLISPKDKITKDIDDDCVSSEASSYCDTDTEIESIQDDPEEPRDLLGVKDRLKEKKYNTVLHFHVDTARVIDNGRHLNRAQTRNVLATYAKHMKESFPWFDVKTANIFELVDKKHPFPVPHFDHTYVFQAPSSGSSPHQFLLRDMPANRKKSPLKGTPNVSDRRKCSLCAREGDGEPNGSGRLLYLGQDEWMHINCGLWSSEVYEEVDGGLQNVYLAVNRGRLVKCSTCQERGATVGCCHKTCQATYHFLCARESDCQFMEDKRIYCPVHMSAANGEEKSDDFEVGRCVYVDMDSEKKKWRQVPGNRVSIIIGSLVVKNLGRIVSESDSAEALIPVDFVCSRKYWSTVDPTKQVTYTCRTKKVSPSLEESLLCIGGAPVHRTIDHSQGEEGVQREMAAVKRWFKQLEESKVEKKSRETNIIPPHLCPLYRSITAREGVKVVERVTRCCTPPAVVESDVRQCIDDIIDKVSRSVEEESLLFDTDLPAIVSADDNELISMVLNDLDACDPLPLHSTPSTSGRPSPLDMDFLSTCEQMLDSGKVSHSGNLTQETVGNSQVMMDVDGTAASALTPVLHQTAGLTQPVLQHPQTHPLHHEQQHPQTHPLHEEQHPQTHPLHEQQHPQTHPLHEQQHTQTHPLHEQQHPQTHPLHEQQHPQTHPLHEQQHPQTHPLHEQQHTQIHTLHHEQQHLQIHHNPTASTSTSSSSSYQVQLPPPSSMMDDDVKESIVDTVAPPPTQHHQQLGSVPFIPLSSAKSESSSGSIQSTTTSSSSDTKSYSSSSSNSSSSTGEENSSPERGANSVTSNTSSPDSCCRPALENSSNLDSNSGSESSQSNRSIPQNSGSLTTSKSSSALKQICRVLPMPSTANSRRSSSASDHSDAITHDQSPPVSRRSRRISNDQDCISMGGRSSERKKICMKRNYKTVIKKYPLRSGMRKSKPYETVQIEINETIEIPREDSSMMRKNLKRKWSEILDTDGEQEDDEVENRKDGKECKVDQEGQEHHSGRDGSDEENGKENSVSKKVLKFSDDSRDITVSIVNNNNNLCEFSKSRVHKYRHKTVLQLDGAADGSSSSAEMSESQDEGTAEGEKSQDQEDSHSPPLHSALAMRIKEQSLLRSLPGEEGPYKCSKCKRLYRTKESYEKHIETCTFEVDSSSTSEEEDDHDNDFKLEENEDPSGGISLPFSSEKVPESMEADKSDILFTDMQPPDATSFKTPSHDFSTSQNISLIENIVSSLETKEIAGSALGELCQDPVDFNGRPKPSGEEPAMKKMRLESNLPRQPGVHRQVRTAIKKSSLAAGEEVELLQVVQGGPPGTDVFVPPPVSPIKFSPTVKKNMSPRRYSNMRLLRGGRNYQYRRAPAPVPTEEHHYQNTNSSVQMAPAAPLQVAMQPVGNTSAQLITPATPTPATFQQFNGQSSPYSAAPQLASPVTHLSPAMQMASPVTPQVAQQVSPQVNPQPQVLTMVSAPSVAVPQGYTLQYVGSFRDGEIGASGGSLVTYPPTPVVVPQPQLVVAPQQNSVVMPQVMNTNITYSFTTPETLVINQPAMVPGMQQVQYLHQQQPPQTQVMQQHPEQQLNQVMQYNQATVSSQPGHHVAAPSHHMQPAGQIHPSPCFTLSDLHNTNQICTQQQQQQAGVLTPELSFTGTGSKPIQLSQSMNNTITTACNTSSISLPTSSTISSYATPVARQRPQASVAPQIVQPLPTVSTATAVDTTVQETTSHSRLPFSERPISGVRTVATVAPAVITSTSVVSISTCSTTTRLTSSDTSPKVATVRPRPTYSYRDAMKDKLVDRPKVRQEVLHMDRVPQESKDAMKIQEQLQRDASDSESDSETDFASRNADKDKEDRLETQSYKLVLRKDSSASTGFNVLPISGPDAPLPSPEVKELRIKAKVSVGPKRKKAKSRDEEKDLILAAKDITKDLYVNEQLPNFSVNPMHNPSQDDPAIFEKPKTCSTEPYIVFELTSEDGFHVESRHVSEVWQKVFEAVSAARANMKMDSKVASSVQYDSNGPGGAMSGLHMLGLTHNAVQYLLEQLPGAKDCHKYSFQFHRRPQEEGAVEENPSGCARTESFKIRSPYDIFSWLASKHRRMPERSLIQQEEIQLSTTRRATSLELPMAMRYRHLRETAREAVGVFRSSIHGRGLFCKRDIDSGEMVIEYAGQVIRSSMCDMREKDYESKGIGCYMFRIDDDTVIDATMHGNAARFINHSCDPNCYSRVVDILGKKHIIIFALRRIMRGEELTYDYKFPIEDDKIPCTCGTRRCRKYLN